MPFDNGRFNQPYNSLGTQQNNNPHQLLDTNHSADSPHHTLGKGPTQAAAGNHDHDGYLMPVGAIIAWGGSSSSIPVGWHLCDGTAHNSPALQAVLGAATTPDLRDRFIVGAGTSYAVGNTGGESTVTLGLTQIPNHDHGGSTGTDSPDHTHPTAQFTIPYTNNQVGAGGIDAFYGISNSSGTGGASARHTHAISAAGGSQAHENKPPYYALIYIIKI